MSFLTLGSVTATLAAALYQGNPDRNHKLWDIVSTERYILNMQVLISAAFYYIHTRICRVYELNTKMINKPLIDTINNVSTMLYICVYVVNISKRIVIQKII
jgi:hypothetical protein